MANRNDEALRALREAIGLADLAARLDRNAEDRAERADAYLSLNNARCGAHEFIRLHGDALLAALSRPEPAGRVEGATYAEMRADHLAERFCDANCCWSGHHPDCRYFAAHAPQEGAE